MKIPKKPKSIGELMVDVDVTRFAQILDASGPTADDGKYRHWDTMRHVAPPQGLTSEEWWLGTKFARQSLLKPVPLQDAAGRPFRYAMPDAALEMLHTIDQRASGKILLHEVVTNPASRNRYVVNSLIEEAITSSQLEGAVTSRVVAKEMIRSGRPPRDKSERMILNNYVAINFVRDHYREPLTPDFVCRLQKLVTEDTLDDPNHSGRIQVPAEIRVRVEDFYGEVMHSPPPAEQLEDRLVAMCNFANGEGQVGFLHPVVRAIVLHFWLAYDHPFADGNGRTARALFYWGMLRQGYWLAEFLSISRILKGAPSQYGRAFLYTETDENDLTYFLLYQLRVVCRAIDEFHEYLARKIAEVQEVESLLRTSINLNHRQLALLGHALRNPGTRYTFQSHATSHNIVYQSARNDLLDLVVKGLLEQRTQGRKFVFFAPQDLALRLERVG